jgi:hypothetical protein
MGSNLLQKAVKSVGNGEWGREQGARGTRGENLKQVFPLVPNSPCPQVLFPMPNALFPMPYSQCPIPNDSVPGFSNRFFRLPT